MHFKGVKYIIRWVCKSFLQDEFSGVWEICLKNKVNFLFTWSATKTALKVYYLIFYASFCKLQSISDFFNYKVIILNQNNQGGNWGEGVIVYPCGIQIKCITLMSVYSFSSLWCLQSFKTLLHNNQVPERERARRNLKELRP